MLPEEFGNLSVSQKLELIELLWDSIPEPSEEKQIPEWHREELERRIAAADAAPEKAIPWEKVKAQNRCRSTK